MAIKYSKKYLNKLEDLMAETDYVLRYEKGNFKSGYCIIKDTKVAVINKYYALEGKVNCIIDVIKSIEVDSSQLSEKNQILFTELQQTELKL
jgi:predicted nuclease with TOPRIM domain